MRLHVAVIHTSDGIRLLLAGRSVEEVNDELALYIREHAETLLWPEEGERVRRYLDSGRVSEAIATFFARVGDRWDAEYLHRTSVQVDGPAVQGGARFGAADPSAGRELHGSAAGRGSPGSLPVRRMRLLTSQRAG